MNNIERYNSINKKRLVEKKIVTFIPTPDDSDYKRGYVVRYFIQKTNDKGSPIYEVKRNHVGNYSKNPIYTTASLRWRITGPKTTQYDDEGNIFNRAVSESNRIAIKLVGDKIPNLKLYLPNLLQFYKS